MKENALVQLPSGACQSQLAAKSHILCPNRSLTHTDCYSVLDCFRNESNRVLPDSWRASRRQATPMSFEAPRARQGTPFPLME